MSYEVEIKYRAVNHAEVAQTLIALGATFESAAVQEDTYLSHPARDFAKTNEAFRIRRIGEENRITYKGPRREGPTKTREEIEIAFTEGGDTYDQMSRLFNNLGFQPVAVLRKTRRSYHLSYLGHEIEVALDSAEGLGDFAEVEVVARDESDLPTAQKAVLELAGNLGLTEVEPRSYLRMNLERRAESR